MNSVFIALDYFSALFMILLSLVVLSMKRDSFKQDVYLLLFTLSMGLLFIVDGTGYLLSESQYITISRILTCLNLPLLNIGLIFFHLYLKSFVHNKKRRTKIDTIILYVIALVSSILWITIVFGNDYIYISDFNKVDHINNYLLNLLLTSCLLIYDIFFVILNLKQFSRKSLISWLFFGALPFVALVIDNVYETSFLYPTMTFSILLVYVVIFLERNKENYNNRIELNKKDLELENTKIKVVMSQIQPHFLYNVLSSIMAIPGNPKETKDAIGDFSNYLRKNLDSVNYDEAIPFENELNHVKLYVKLEQLRFGDEVNVIYNIKSKDFKVPVLSLQTLVENAIKHGISLKRGGGTVTVSTRKYKGENIITVVDDGMGFDTSKPLDKSRSHIGVMSTKKRLHIMVDGTLDIESKEGKGTKVTIRIPIKGDN